MSDIEHDKGILIPILRSKDLENAAKCIFKFEKWTTDAPTYLEALSDIGYRKYIVINNTIYKINNTKLDIDDILRSSKNANGSINYEVKFYNGGCDFNEALNGAYENMDDNSNVVTCVYCGYKFPEGTPSSQHILLTEHIKVCKKHPMREAEQKIIRLRKALTDLIGADTKEDLIKMKLILITSVDEPNIAINAIDTLIGVIGK